jgi:dolichol-phosphate mannosyltransferase
LLLKAKVIEQLYSTQLIVAALNEEQGIGPTLTDYIDNLGIMKVLVIDGNSRDRTVEIAKNLGAEITFQEGRGKGNAIAKAVQKIDPKVKYIILTDADYTYPAKYVPKMIEILENNSKIGMVCGNRFSGNVELKAVKKSFIFGNKFLTLAHTLLNGVMLSDPLTGLRVIRTETLKNWVIKSQGFDIEVELNHQVKKKGYEIKEIPIGYRKRLGEKKLKIKDGLIILQRIISEIIR